jgi:hypothetical protein
VEAGGWLPLQPVHWGAEVKRGRGRIERCGCGIAMLARGTSEHNGPPGLELPHLFVVSLTHAVWGFLVVDQGRGNRLHFLRRTPVACS